MLVEDQRQRARRDDAMLVALGVVERKFNPAEPRDPHTGKWACHAAAARLRRPHDAGGG
jgi:hypothetical protein